MKKRILIVILLTFIAISLLGCKSASPGDSPLTTEVAIDKVQRGTEGVRISLQPNYPPNTIYDQNELIALVNVENKGNYNLEDQDCFIHATGFDPNIIRFRPFISCAENIGTLEGKSIYNVEGSSNQVEFRSPPINLDALGVFEYDPRLNFLACYSYITKATPTICIDPSFYQLTSEQKSCTARDVSTPGGQGGPVGISYVGVDMAGERAIFEINVVNYGGGRALSPFTSLQTCGQGNIDFYDFDRIRYSVELSGRNLVECNPRDGFVRLTNNQGKIICSFDIPGTVAYETPLLVELDYNYMDSISKEVRIINTPG